MRRRNRDGFVLFSVIWIAGLLAVIVTTFAISIQLHVRSQANLIQSYRAEMEADGLARLVGARLARASLTDSSAFGLPMNGEVVSCGLDDKAQAAISLQDQAGLVDLNQISPATLKAMLGQLGFPQAEAVAQALVDYRDQDDVAFGGSGEEASLVSGGPAPKNAAFQSVDEIAQVIPESMADLSSLAALFTVYSLQAGVDASVAPRWLKAVVDGSSGEGRMPLAQSPRKAFAIDVQVRRASGVIFRRIAVVTLLRLPERPFAILEWRQAESARAEKDVQPPGMACAALGAS